MLQKPEFYRAIRAKLPQAIIDGVLSYDTTLKVEEIGAKHKLQIDQIGILVDIIQDIGYGILASKDFLETLKTEIELPQEELLLLASDINEQIFKPVRAEMLKTFKDEAPNKPRTIATIDENDTHHETLSKADILSEIENPHPVVTRKETGSGQLIVNSNKEVSSEKLIVDSKKENITSSVSDLPTLPTPNLSSITYPLSTASAVSPDIRARLLSSLGEDKLSHVVTMKKAKEVGSEQVVVGSKENLQTTNNKLKTSPETSAPVPVLPTTHFSLPTSSPVSPKLQALSEIKTKIKDPFRREVSSEELIVNSQIETIRNKNSDIPPAPRIVDPYREQIN
jgi:hypothetical protein